MQIAYSYRRESAVIVLASEPFLERRRFLISYISMFETNEFEFIGG